MRSAESYRVLVVDNDPVFREFAVVLFRARNQYLVTAETGLEALRILEKDSIEVVVTDLVMPNIDGAMLCSIIRSHPDWSDIRTVLVSAAAKEALGDLVSIGADLYIAKGPLVQMGRQLEQALAILASGERPSDPVLGLDAVHSRRITRELLWENRLLYSILDGMAEAALFLAADGSVIRLNRSASAIWSVEPLDLIGRNIGDIAPELAGISEYHVGTPKSVVLAGRHFEVQRYRVDGDERSVFPILLRDVTAERESKRKLEETLEDRELLLREIHHRIKNNLLGVSSYISLLKSSRGGSDKKRALENVDAHVNAIARVHERLYAGTTLSSVSGRELIEELVSDIVALFSDDTDVRTDFALEDVELPTNVSIPVGLIVAELVTNSLRHAVTSHGLRLSVSLNRRDDGSVALQFRDDGPGLPQEALSQRRRSLGLTIIEGLARQLRASVEFESRGGTTVTFVLPAFW